MALNLSELVEVLVYEGAFDENIIEVMDELADFVADACARGQPDDIDQLMDVLDTDDVDTIYLVGLLRYTFPLAGDLRRWKEFRDRCVISSHRKAEDIGKHYSGMLLDEDVDSYHLTRTARRLAGLEIKHSNPL